jgi:AcrR family transcriptional regulator
MNPDAQKPRRTQAERSEETRARVLEAAIRCLHARGYAATTTLLVAEEAQVSRGAMLHQFPTKVDLMLFVVRAVYDREVAEYVVRVGHIRDPREKLLALPEVTWDVLSRPSGVAVLEVLQGSRSDPELAERLLPLQGAIETESFAWARRYDEIFGAPITTPLLRLMVWTIRGLSVAKTLDPEADLERPVELLRDMLATALENGLERSPLAN